MVLRWATRPSRTNMDTHTHTKCPFHHRGLESKSRNSRYTFSNGQVWPWSTNEAGKRLTKFCQENALVITNTLFQQYKRWPYTWTSADGQYWNQTDYILCSCWWRRSIQSAKTRAWAGSDHELLIAKFSFNLKKVGDISNPLLHSGSDQ